MAHWDNRALFTQGLQVRVHLGNYGISPKVNFPNAFSVPTKSLCRYSNLVPCLASKLSCADRGDAFPLFHKKIKWSTQGLVVFGDVPQLLGLRYSPVLKRNLIEISDSISLPVRKGTICEIARQSHRSALAKPAVVRWLSTEVTRKLWVYRPSISRDILFRGERFYEFV